MARILIAEDEPRISQFLVKGLGAAGFVTEVVTDGVTAAARARSEDFDLLVLDVGLPGLDGFEVLQAIRGRGEELPVVVLTARDSLESTVEGFELGADDYLTKPFRFDELLVRIRARLRGAAGGAGGATELGVVEAGGIRLDLRTRRATVAGRLVDLSGKEFQLAELFLSHRGQVLSREQLLARAWGYDFDPESNVVEVYVGYLRRKLGKAAIETVRGVGYRYVGI